MLALIFYIISISASMEVEANVGLVSFLEVAADSEFPLENIPFGVFSPAENHEDKRCSTRIGNFVIDLKALENEGIFKGALFSALKNKVFQSHVLNPFMSLSKAHWKQARESIQHTFSNESAIKDNAELQKAVVWQLEKVQMHLPAQIGDYTDFYSSRSHAFNVGSIIRGAANAMNENWLQIPIGYHGRSSSIVSSGVELRRPRGQTKAKDATVPSFTDCKRLDFEMEMGAFIGGQPNELGKPVKVNQAWENIFGFVLLNDWSFRDFQTWEYVPLGPFTAKNGISTISPWIITTEALKGSEVPLSVQQPVPLKYLQEDKHMSFDIKLNVAIKTAKAEAYQNLVQTNFKYLYWSCTQQLAHHSVSGCNMRAGDLLGSGTISGDKKEEFGSLLELTWGGRDEIPLENGETMKFIKDGDSILMTGHANINGKTIGFGNCEGTVLPALSEEEYY